MIVADNVNRETKNLAESLIDFNREIEHESSLMNCFCYSRYLAIGSEVATLTLNAPDSDTVVYPCRKWLLTYRSGRFSVYNLALFIVIMNYLVRFLALCTSKWEGHHSLVAMKKSATKKT